MTVDRNVIAIFQGSQLIEKARPEKGFFIKSKKRYLSPKDGREHSKFSWESVTVGDLLAAASNRLTSLSADRVTRCLAVTSWMPIAWT